MPVSQPSPTTSTRFLDIRKRLLDTGLLAIKVTEPKGSEDGKEALLALPSPPPDNSSFDFALISAVVEINTNDYWLTADANYHGPSDIWPDYAIIKPSCICQMPDVAPFMADWGDVTDNLRWLQEDVATPTFKAKQGLFTTAGATGPRFKMRHVLFEPLDSDELVTKEEGKTDQNDSDALDGIFSIENWPAFSDAARGGLDSIKQTHHVIPIPAYDLEGKLIDPRYYRRHLEGAVAEVHFNLSHWSIAWQGVPGKDVYTADIVLIRVIAPPRTHTPLKRKVSAFIHPDSSPTKCPRV
ncbi:hypothetical protein SCLCIDRAFT_27285 [Scleroderma citrinum Foug A]|uniref:Uncharacterized protein n=1 Tax=Scleroderma citrinum Foug A TaxID=1036808 RepID=A0A0C3DFF7_9AGAM|nr:hypothetical protein SCLCIDRAFT_27285 [Scleroderma citrinum Foug A]